MKHWIACLLLLVACSSEDSTTTEQTEPDAAQSAPGETVDAAPCVHCSAITAGPLDQANLCTASRPIVTNLMTCLCGPGAACDAVCAADVCAGAALSTECRNCAATTCTDQALACLADR